MAHYNSSDGGSRHAEASRRSSCAITENVGRDGDASLAARLVSLQDVGEGLQARLHHLQRVLASPAVRPDALKNPAFEKFRQVLERKYPQGKIGHNKRALKFVQASEDIRSELKDPFFTILNAYRFKRNVLALLNHASMIFTHIPQYANISQVAWHMLRLLTKYVQVQIQLANIKDSKLITAMYRSATHIHLKSSDASSQEDERDQNQFDKLASYLVVLGTEPTKFVQGEFLEMHAFSNIIKSALLALAPTYLALFKTDDLVRQAILEIEPSDAQLEQPADHRTFLPCLSKDEAHAWICYSLSSVPMILASSELLESGTLMDLLCMACTQSCMVPVYRDQAVPISNLVQHLFNNFPSKDIRFANLAKVEKAFREAHTGAISTFAAHHEHLRSYLIITLERMIAILRDNCGVLGPRGPTVLAALTFSRAEILTYLRHGNDLKTTSTLDHGDLSFARLLSLHLELATLVNENGAIYSEYNKECLATLDVANLDALLAAAPSDVEHLLDDLHSLRANLASQNLDETKTAILLCTQVEITLLKIQTAYRGLPRKGTWDSAALDCVVSISQRLEVVSDRHAVFCNYTSLRDLLFFRVPMDHALETVLNATFGRAQDAIALVQVLQDSIQILHRLNQDDAVHASHNAIHSANERLRLIIRKLDNWTSVLYEQRLKTLHDTSTAIAALKEFRAFSSPRHSTTSSKSARKGNQSESDTNTSQIPGSESRAQNSLTIQDLKHTKSSVLKLAQSLSHEHLQTIVIWNREFSPRELLRSALTTWFSKRIEDSITFATQVDMIQRPSECLRRIAAAIEVLVMIGENSGLDHTLVIRKVLYDHQGGSQESWLGDMTKVPHQALEKASAAHRRIYVDNPLSEQSASRNDVASKPSETRKREQTLSETLAAWLAYFVEDRLATGTDGSAFVDCSLSPEMISFVVRPPDEQGGSSDSKRKGEAKLRNRSPDTSGSVASFATSAAEDGVSFKVASGQCTSSPIWQMPLSGLAIPGLVFAPHRRSFVVVPDLLLRLRQSKRLASLPSADALDAEQWLSQNEIEATVTLLGARGTRVVERHLLAIVTTQVGCIFQALYTAHEGLAEVRASIIQEDPRTVVELCTRVANQHLKKLTAGLAALVTAGHALEILELLLAAQQRHLTKRNVRSLEGVNLNTLLTAALADVPTKDFSLWLHVPFLVATSLCTGAWKTAEPLRQLGALANNLHVVPKTMRQILQALLTKASTRFPGSEGDAVLRQALEHHIFAVVRVVKSFEVLRLTPLWPSDAMQVYFDFIVSDASRLVSSKTLPFALENFVSKSMGSSNELTRYLTSASASWQNAWSGAIEKQINRAAEAG